jgi:RHS repeat-associated protein
LVKLAANNFIAAKTVKELTLNKSFSYNLLNLPATSTFATGSATFAYDAAGNKLRKASTVSGTTTYTDYIAGIQHSGTTSESIEYIMTEEGQAVPNGTTSYNYEYFLGDNLGNTRRTFDISTGAARLVQSDDYYPFGWAVNSLVTGTQNYYLYNKKELQPETGYYDYGARGYDPVIARWTSVDPLAEINRRWSPYNYARNNPIRNIDPDGMAVVETAEGTTYTGDDIAPELNKLKSQFGNSDKEPDDNSESKGPTWSSKYGFFVHQHANRVGLYRGKNNANDPDLMTELDELNAGTEYADSDPFQTGNNSYRHAMRNSNQTVAQAKNEADAFVRKQFALAQKLKAEGKVAEAYYQFAIGLHTLQDATSPAHAGFQSWSDHPSAL